MVVTLVGDPRDGCASALFFQVKYRAATVNANEIANNVLSCLVAISSSCPILQYYQASLVGSELVVCG